MSALPMAYQSSPLIDGLREASAYPHAVGDIEVRETHISWVILTGEYAYKIKKPVRFDFLDFSTLERRLHFCREELRLNRRYAADLYLDVVPITILQSGPRIGGHGEPVEYAVKMRQFDERELLDRCLKEGRLTADHVDALTRTLAGFHAQADTAPLDSRFGRGRLVLGEARDNFAVLTHRIPDPPQAGQLERLSQWTDEEAGGLMGVFEQRRADGHVRECHGDLHLGNMFLHGGGVTFFDGIEFNEDFRWIDVMSELAFTVMDFNDRGRRDFGNRLLNAYLERSGDYDGLNVLRFYVVYRALVRAKVDALRLSQTYPDDPSGADLTGELQSYLDLAEELTRRAAPRLLITCGVSGSGKTTGTQMLVDQSGLIRIRSDVERKRLFGIAPDESAAADVGGGVYRDAATRDTYNRLADLAREVIGAGYGVVVDATFLRRVQRRQLRTLAEELDVPFQIAEFDEDPEELRRRVVDRVHQGLDASDAGLTVLEHQLQTREPLTDDERPFVVEVAPQAV